MISLSNKRNSTQQTAETIILGSNRALLSSPVQEAPLQPTFTNRLPEQQQQLNRLMTNYRPEVYNSQSMAGIMSQNQFLPEKSVQTHRKVPSGVTNVAQYPTPTANYQFQPQPMFVPQFQTAQDVRPTYNQTMASTPNINPYPKTSQPTPNNYIPYQPASTKIQPNNGFNQKNNVLSTQLNGYNSQMNGYNSQPDNYNTQQNSYISQPNSYNPQFNGYSGNSVYYQGIPMPLGNMNPTVQNSQKVMIPAKFDKKITEQGYTSSIEDDNVTVVKGRQNQTQNAAELKSINISQLQSLAVSTHDIPVKTSKSEMVELYHNGNQHLCLLFGKLKERQDQFTQIFREPYEH